MRHVASLELITSSSTNLLKLICDPKPSSNRIRNCDKTLNDPYNCIFYFQIIWCPRGKTELLGLFHTYFMACHCLFKHWLCVEDCIVFLSMLRASMGLNWSLRLLLPWWALGHQVKQHPTFSWAAVYSLVPAYCGYSDHVGRQIPEHFLPFLYLFFLFSFRPLQTHKS